MILSVRREEFHPACTIGRLFVDGVFECYTLEDAVRERDEPVVRWKVPGLTAIPKGTYPVQVTLSQRFNKLLPLLVGVPGFSGVRIHPGNTDADTEGCILVGTGKRDYAITGSRVAFQNLFHKIQLACDRKEEVSITIKGDRA